MRSETKVLIGVAVLATVIYGSVKGGSSDGNTVYGTDIGKAACEDAVKDQLLSPATAHFHGVFRTGNNYNGYVDSQNGFGATLTAFWGCDTDGAGSVTDTPLLTSR